MHMKVNKMQAKFNAKMSAFLLFWLVSGKFRGLFASSLTLGSKWVLCLSALYAKIRYYVDANVRNSAHVPMAPLAFPMPPP